ncbi:MAG: SDR family NAD(P)-dependent oxidoreductase [Bacteroidota bacterium]
MNPIYSPTTTKSSYAPISLEGKEVIVTGASRGIGKAIALQLAEAGANLHLLGRNIETLKAVQSESSGSTREAMVYKVDLTDDTDLKIFVKSFLNSHHKVDILIHNAGMIHMGPVAKCPPSDFDKIFQLNVRAPYALVHHLMPAFQEEFAQVLMINSTVTPRANLSQYAASKQALQSVTDSLRQEVNENNIRVMSIYPGSTATDMLKQVYAYAGRTVCNPERLLQPEDIAHTVHHMLTMPRTAEITDVKIRPFLKP